MRSLTGYAAVAVLMGSTARAAPAADAVHSLPGWTEADGSPKPLPTAMCKAPTTARDREGKVGKVACTDLLLSGGADGWPFSARGPLPLSHSLALPHHTAPAFVGQR